MVSPANFLKIRRTEQLGRFRHFVFNKLALESAKFLMLFFGLSVFILPFSKENKLEARDNAFKTIFYR